MLNPEIINETSVSFKEGRKLACVGNRGPLYRTLLRWAKKGVKSRRHPGDPRITLEYCYLGERLYTSVEAFERWMKKTN